VTPAQTGEAPIRPVQKLTKNPPSARRILRTEPCGRFKIVANTTRTT